MGDRSNLYFRDGDNGIGVYSRWAGTGIAEAAMAVLQCKPFEKRLGDPSYAMRIGVQVALETLGAKTTEETGYGLWTNADLVEDPTAGKIEKKMRAGL